MFLDPRYFIIVGPAIIFSMWAQYKVKNSYRRYSKVAASSGLSGSELARMLLDRNGLNDVAVEPIAGELTDNYDPRMKVLRLSNDIYSGRSLAALGVAAHETGHALQDKGGYLPMRFRSGLVPVASFGSRLAPMLILAGIFLLYSRLLLGNIFLEIGIVLFAVAVLFQLITLPVEFNASSRALAALSGGGYIRREEYDGAKKVLSAAALTYLAAALASIMQLIYFILLSQRRR